MKNQRLHILCATVFIVSVVILTGCKKDKDEFIVDADGNKYTAVTIGDQVWLVGDLKTTSFNDGTEIPLIIDGAEWAAAAGSAYCFYDNNISNKDTYGALYNWYAVNTGKLCPAGWHVSSKADWDELVDFLGGDAVAGGKLKTTGTVEGGDGLWFQPNVSATNEYGLSIVPGGERSAGSGGFFDLGYGGLWWSSTEFDANRGYFYYINNVDAAVGASDAGKRNGFSVRCVKN